MLDDLKHYAKYAGLWLTTRGVVSLAILTATVGLGMSGYAAPLIALPIGLAAATYMHYDRASYLKTRVKNAYKLEIAATLSKDPKTVTLNDLTRVAEGDKDAGLAGNPVLQEQLERISKHKNLSNITTASAIGIAVLSFLAILGGGFDHVIDAWKGFIEPLSNSLPISNQAVFAAGTLASGISLASDYTLHHIGMNAMKLNERTTYDIVQDIKRLRRVGKTVAPEQVFEVFISRDPKLQEDIAEVFGVTYAALSKQQKAEVLDAYAQKAQVVSITEKINAGRVSANELSFLVAGQHSGIAERNPKQYNHIHLFLPNIGRSGAVEQSAPAQTTAPAPQGTQPTVPATDEAYAQTANRASTNSFVERYIASVSGDREEGLTHVDRLLKESQRTQSASTERGQ